MDRDASIGATRVVITQPKRWSSDGHANLAGIRRSVRQALTDGLAAERPEHTIVVLPELIGAELTDDDYRAAVASLACGWRSWVVAGSHYDRRHDGVVNRGVVADPTGDIVSEYEKLRPYAMESARGVRPGSTVGSFDVGGRRVVVLICADFWYADSFSQHSTGADLVVVPSFSISQRPSPLWSRALWRNMSVARAYEFTTFVAISDWAHPCAFEGLPSSSVSGLADPNPGRHDHLFQPIGRRVAAAHDLDFAGIDALRDNRADRSFGAVGSVR